MIRHLYLFILLCLISVRAAAQAQDCFGGVHVCQTSYSQTTSTIGSGTVSELNPSNEGCINNGVGLGELNSAWYIITVSAPGTLVFTITPNISTTDYDWGMWDITAQGCPAIYNYTTNTFNNYPPIRCNASGNTGPTGMSTSATSPTEPGGNFPTFSSSLAVTAGQVFAICVSNWTGNTSGYTIDFSGSTTSIFDTVKPVYNTIGTYCGATDSISFDMSEAITCSSLAADGSDFYITSASAVPPAPIAATGTTCLAAGASTTTINLKFGGTLPAGIYYLHPQNGSDGNTLIDACGNSQDAGDSIQFTILAPPQTFFGQDTTCIHDSLQLQFAVYNATPGITYHYLWSPNSYLNNDTIATPKFSPPVSTTYTVTITQNDSTLCSGTAVVPIVVLQGFTLLSHDTTICKGATIQLNAVGDPGYYYTWSPSANVANPTSLNTSVQPQITTTLVLTASFPGCTDSSQSFVATLGLNPIINAGPDTTTCVNNSLQLTVQIANPNPNYVISWQPNVDINDNTIQNPIVTPPVTTSYTVTVTDASVGTVCQSIDTININVLQGFTLLNQDTGICRGASVQLNATGSARYTYTWSPTTYLSDPLLLNPVATPDSTVTYTLTASFPGCADSAESVNISVGTIPSIKASNDTITCINTPVQLNVTVFNGQPAYGIQWFPNQYIDNDTAHNPVVDPPFDEPYVVTVTDLSTPTHCRSSDTVNVVELQGFTIFNHDSAICRGAAIQISATGDPRYTYFWNPAVSLSNPNIINPVASPDTTTTYIITARYPGCYDSVTTLKFDVQPVPSIFLPGGLSKCTPDTLKILAGVSPESTEYTYRWSPGTAFPDSTTLQPLFISDTTTLLHLIVLTPAGCSDTDSVVVTVWPANFSALSNSDTGICPRDSVYLSVAGGAIYDWEPAIGLSDATIANPIASPTAQTLYTLYVTDIHGCRDTQNIRITVYPAAFIDLGDSLTVNPGETYQLNPQTNCLTFAWFPPLGLSDPNISNPIATPEVNTRYIVTGRTEFGCVATDSISIYVDPETLLALPNAFAPGTGSNSNLTIIKKGSATLKYFRVFNRWGNQVFQTSDIAKGWDGMFNGSPQPFGVYIYEIDAVTSAGREFTKQGNITLIR